MSIHQNAMRKHGGSRADRPLLGYQQACAQCGHASSIHAALTSPKGALVRRLGGRCWRTRPGGFCDCPGYEPALVEKAL